MTDMELGRMTPTDMTHDTTQRQHTLTSIAQESGVQKRTVQRWLKKHLESLGEGAEFGVIEGETRYFDDTEKAALMTYQVKRPGKEEAPEVEAIGQNAEAHTQAMPVTPASIEIYQGNHQQTLAPINLSGSRDLGLLRSPYTEIKTFDDPLAMAKEVLNQNNAIIGAMSHDLQERQAQINRTTEALELVEQSNQNLRDQTLAYQIETRVQAATLNQATTQLQQKIAIQQSLGKPQSGAQAPGQQ
ncbi:MAG: hypothetical protein AAGE59_26020 [Cyanobacteria bacterium P01_F01_bin.86]